VLLPGSVNVAMICVTSQPGAVARMYVYEGSCLCHSRMLNALT